MRKCFPHGPVTFLVKKPSTRDLEKADSTSQQNGSGTMSLPKSDINKHGAEGKLTKDQAL